MPLTDYVDIIVKSLEVHLKDSMTHQNIFAALALVVEEVKKNKEIDEKLLPTLCEQCMESYSSIGVGELNNKVDFIELFKETLDERLVYIDEANGHSYRP